MTMWKPTLSNREQPLYLAIANAIAEDISSGKLADGERLPPQRDLPRELPGWNTPPPSAMPRELLESASKHLSNGGASPLVDYLPHAGHPRHRAAAAKLLK